MRAGWSQDLALRPVPDELAPLWVAQVCAIYFSGADPNSPLWATAALSGGRGKLLLPQVALQPASTLRRIQFKPAGLLVAVQCRIGLSESLPKNMFPFSLWW